MTAETRFNLIRQPGIASRVLGCRATRATGRYSNIAPNLFRLAGICAAALFLSATPLSTKQAAAQKAVDAKAAWTGEIGLGMVTSNPTKAFPRLEALAYHLAAKLKPHGVAGVNVVTARDNRQMMSYLRSGAVHLVSESIFSGLSFVEHAGAKIIARQWKKGLPVYHSVVITRKDSGINSLADLAGKKVAFEDKGSTSGFLLPLSILKRHSLQAQELHSPRAKTPVGKIGYVFAGSETNIMAWVVRGFVDAGAIGSSDWDDPSRMPARFKEQLRIIYKSDPHIRSLLLASGRLPQGLVSRIQDILFSMHEDPNAADVLRMYYRVTKFDAVQGDVARSLAKSRRLYRLIKPAKGF